MTYWRQIKLVLKMRGHLCYSLLDYLLQGIPLRIGTVKRHNYNGILSCGWFYKFNIPIICLFIFPLLTTLSIDHQIIRRLNRINM